MAIWVIRRECPVSSAKALFQPPYIPLVLNALSNMMVKEAEYGGKILTHLCGRSI